MSNQSYTSFHYWSSPINEGIEIPDAEEEDYGFLPPTSPSLPKATPYSVLPQTTFNDFNFWKVSLPEVAMDGLDFDEDYESEEEATNPSSMQVAPSPVSSIHFHPPKDSPTKSPLKNQRNNPKELAALPLSFATPAEMTVEEPTFNDFSFWRAPMMELNIDDIDVETEKEEEEEEMES